jgi:hypothetical protein
MIVVNGDDIQLIRKLARTIRVAGAAASEVPPPDVQQLFPRSD